MQICAQTNNICSQNNCDTVELCITVIAEYGNIQCNACNDFLIYFLLFILFYLFLFCFIYLLFFLYFFYEYEDDMNIVMSHNSHLRYMTKL